MGSGLSTGICKADDTVLKQSCTKTKECQDNLSTIQEPTSLAPVQTANEPNNAVRNIQLGNSNEETVNVSKVNKLHKRFYYYSRREACSETMFVSTSAFPYTKPKVVAVRPRPKKDAEKDQSKTCMQHSESSFSSVRNEKFTAKPLNIAQGWSTPSSLPKEIEGKLVLPHKTVLELRQEHRCQPYGRHYKFTCDMPVSVAPGELGQPGGRKRPPTPVPSDWFPVERTNDYLVASSLLAMEQTKRRSNQDAHIHNF